MAEREARLVLFNIAKRRNFGMLIRSANAFGVGEIVIVGRKRFNTFGNQGTRQDVRYKHVYTLEQARDYLREDGFTLYGVEIVEAAEPVEAHPFAARSAFLMGNEGTGLSPAQIALCERFVYIRQHGHGASLNVNVAGAIVLHHFAVWAGFDENPRRGAKFLPRPLGPQPLDAAGAEG